VSDRIMRNDLMKNIPNKRGDFIAFIYSYGGLTNICL